MAGRERVEHILGWQGMGRQEVVGAVRRRFAETGSPVRVPLLTRGSFMAELSEQGVYVDNLGSAPFLPWAAFEAAVEVLAKSEGRARRGDAMKAKLGEPGLPLGSVEGYIAQAVYGKRKGDTVFRRITPIACILIWAGVCRHAPGELILRDPPRRMSVSGAEDGPVGGQPWSKDPRWGA